MSRISKTLVHGLVEFAADATPDATALVYRDQRVSYSALWVQISSAAAGFLSLGTRKHDRIAIYLDKSVQTVVSMLGATAAGGAYVPINPVLRPPQVAHILRDSGAIVLVTTRQRLSQLAEEIRKLAAIPIVVLTDGDGSDAVPGIEVRSWTELTNNTSDRRPTRMIDANIAAILYTSGSTGLPKGVVLSHHNIVAGAVSVSSYLENRADDRILSVLPLSFDAGMSQLTTGFNVGATVVLLNYLVPADIVRACDKHKITGITAVPPLWFKIVQEEWPQSASESVRYIANTGGHMPRPTLGSLRSIFRNAKPYLMYGLTEAFRSTYLDPSQVDTRPDSIGKAIPNAEILVVRANGEECAPEEPGELVHRGALVSMGYWNDPEMTAKRFKPAPQQLPGIIVPEIAVWSGDLVRRDAEGFLYFVGRNDEMIKTSGYRVSPTEIEEALLGTGLVAEVAAFGVPHPELGQSIVVVAVPPKGQKLDVKKIVDECRKALPLYMVPERIEERADLPRNPNGKIDRKVLKQEISQ